MVILIRLESPVNQVASRPSQDGAPADSASTDELEELFNQPGDNQSGAFSNIQHEDRAKQDILNFLLDPQSETPNFNFDPVTPGDSSSAAPTHSSSPSSAEVNHSNNNQSGDSSSSGGHQVFKVPLPPKPKNSVA